jgi:hypothetical protein
VESEARDTDGVIIHVLLHVVDGKASELEFFKEDSSRILALRKLTNGQSVQSAS